MWGGVGQRETGNIKEKEKKRKQGKQSRKRQDDEMMQHQIDHVLNHRGWAWAWRTTKESLLSQDMGSLFIRDFIFNTKTLLVQTKWCGFKKNESTLQ